MNKRLDNIRMHGMTAKIRILAFMWELEYKRQHRTKKTQGYFPTFWALPVCRTLQSENHNLVYTVKFHLMATF